MFKLGAFWKFIIVGFILNIMCQCYFGTNLLFVLFIIASGGPNL